LKASRSSEDAGFSHALLLGMGWSSLGPEAARMTFGKIVGYPELHVWIRPIRQVKTIERRWTSRHFHRR
jgi:hypothetical protein